MGYLAIARKWRPSRFEDLVGQAHVVQTLKNAIRLDRVAHAYLFSGARGVGKTSVARIFAKALRCPNAKDAIPCNQCPECLSIADSRSVDVMEIDGASNNGVEAVRSIRENVAYGPSSGTYKIYIIDEVHMLSLSAFNALLKTLEEPPSHVIFIFATTEAQKLPLTILSRCQRFEFRRLTHSQIVDRIKFILADENVLVTEEGLRTLASHSDGSLRDGLSLLDQVLSYFGDRPLSGVPIEEAQIVEALGVNQTSQITTFLGCLLQKDSKGALALINDSYLAGIDLKHFAERCLEELRLLYMMTVARINAEEVSAETLDVSNSHYTALKELAGSTQLIVLERMAQIFSKVLGQLGWSSLPRFGLEMAAVRICHLQDLAKVEQALMGKANAGSGEKPPESVAIARNPTPVERKMESRETAMAPPPAALRVAASPSESQPERAPSPTPADRETDEANWTTSVPSVDSRPIASAPSAATQAWRAFVEAVMKRRPLLGALLCHANFKIENGERGGKNVLLAFPEGSFYERQARDSKQQIEDQLKQFFGPQTVFALSPASANTTTSIEQTKQEEAAGLKKTALEHPTVVKMKEILGAEVVDVNADV